MNTVGVADGILKVWITNITDGGAATLVMNSSNRIYRVSAEPNGFFNRHYNVTWGGSSPNLKLGTSYANLIFIAGFGAGAAGGTDTTNPNPPTSLTAQ